MVDQRLYGQALFQHLWVLLSADPEHESITFAWASPGDAELTVIWTTQVNSIVATAPILVPPWPHL